MPVEHKAKYKPLSFDTTMRNPERIAGFLNCLLEFEGQTLNNGVIHKIVKKVIGSKLYKPNYITNNAHLNAIYDSEDDVFSDAQIEDIITNSPQKHKEAGYDFGWPSRFETWFNLPKEYGLVWYEIGSTIKISTTGHMLIDALNTRPVDNNKIQNVFLNIMCKYQSKNPFRKTLVDNVPFTLLLKVIKRFKDEDPESTGIFRQELSFFISWVDDDDEGLFNYIKNFRRNHRYGEYTEEIIYNNCLSLLGYGEEGKNYIKMNKVTGETVDEYIRKMKITGVLSLRGNGRFLDFNGLKQEKIDYVLNNYSEYSTFGTPEEYFNYMSEVDNNLFDEPEQQDLPALDILRKNKLIELARTYTKEKINKELVYLARKTESKDEIFKFINRPARLEFLTSIALVQNFNNLDVNPAYPIDDEGLPTSTAGGGVADIVCRGVINDEFVEVTLMTGRSDQINNEMIPITRHQKSARATNPHTYSVFVAPRVHEDVTNYISWIKHSEDVDIKAYSITEFIEEISINDSLDDMVID